MKKIILIIQLVICHIFSFSQQTGTFTDPRDGKTYKTVKIGNQVWMAENLNYITIDSWCYNNNKRNCNQYGRLYTWEAAKSACPPGWHLPSKEEFEILLNKTGGNKKTSYNSLIVGGNSGFSVQFGGCSTSKDSFYGIDNCAYIWSSSLFMDNSFKRLTIITASSYVDLLSSPQSSGHSVRCLKDK